MKKLLTETVTNNKLIFFFLRIDSSCHTSVKSEAGKIHDCLFKLFFTTFMYRYHTIPVHQAIFTVWQVGNMCYVPFHSTYRLHEISL